MIMMIYMMRTGAHTSPAPDAVTRDEAEPLRSRAIPILITHKQAS